MKESITLLIPFAPKAPICELRRVRILIEEFSGTLENTTPGVFAGAPATLWRVRFDNREDGCFFARVINQPASITQ